MNARGNVLEIHRFTLQDGPGIRTTVFLKGCPLSCIWCHNPESISRDPEIAYFPLRCIHCSKCSAICPSLAHEIINGLHVYNRTACTKCFACVDVCNFDALRLSGYSMNVNEIMNEVIKDSKYFQQSGGGITISGGEPLAQPQFIKVLLREAKKSGINTCIETSGYASNKIFREVISIADHIIFDLKANASKHRSLTGASNKLINENFKFLLDEKIPFELRCPLIEGVNDDDEHLQNISKIANGNIHVKVRIMPYHNTGLAKNARFGYEPSMAFLESSSEMVKNSWKQRISNFGSNKVSIGF